ncbi:MAG: hypothetical protein LBQ22_08940 [Bacteroidales bacterium]|jgi:hypothetical protein|nr:hypothetical protein [Bacteroidales bacterium]
MKNLLLITTIIALLSILSSCNKNDDAPTLGADVKVTVVNSLGEVQDGVTVYMYKDQEVTNSTKISDAKKQVITDSNGVADFYLSFTELNILESQTSLYFAVFYSLGTENRVAGSVGVTVKRDDVKNLTLEIPL